MALFAGTYTYVNDGVGYAKFAIFGTPVNPISSTIASATTIAPLTYASIVTGTAQIQNINLPWPGFEGDLILIFTDPSPGATLTGGVNGAALALATTVVRFKALTMTYSQITGLWYPGY